MLTVRRLVAIPVLVCALPIYYASRGLSRVAYGMKHVGEKLARLGG
jgi:hypothetical protein